MLTKIFLSLAFLATVKAGCDNQCSGHGTCDVRSICTCYDNWGVGLSHDSGDCSQRICPYEFAWVDTPDKIGSHHKYAECANKGICNRDTGECECFPGYEGKSCGRTTCPNDCSGHGLCKYIEDLSFATTPFDYLVSNSDNEYRRQSAKTFTYYKWDKHMTRGCVCDPEYGDVDCSKRMCPYGTDVMDIRNDMTSTGKYQVQHLHFFRQFALTAAETRTFALTFKSKLNETFTTIPIVYADGISGTSSIHTFMRSVENALESLPNQVIDDVKVAGSFNNVGNSGYYNTYINITFTGANVQGPQNLITVKAYSCTDGCTPYLSGIELMPYVHNVTQITASDYNSYECGRRGRCDYTTGLCQCHTGYTGAACNIITALV